MHSYKKSSQHCMALLSKELENNGLYEFEKLINPRNYESQGETDQNLRRNDCISHLILRSAFSFEHEKRQWFFKQEVKLFQWRISTLNKESIEAFNRINGLQYTAISKEEKQKMKENLKLSCCNSEDIDNIKFYKVHFISVLNLVAKRQIFLKNGVAYVPETRISALILYEFKKALNKGFAYSRETAANACDDERITTIFNVLSNCVNIKQIRFDRHGRVFISELNELSRTSYPLCMKLLHQALTTNHHLTNGGRVQYCLFLKGIDLRAGDALQFWKNEFLKKVNERTFEWEYKYGIRHLYGQEGKRANYEPFPCHRILSSTIGLRDNDGCPFKHMSYEVLRKTLSKYGLVQLDIETVMQLLKEGFYFKACKKYYEISHNCIIENTFEHPNVYFDQSRKVFENTSSHSED